MRQIARQCGYTNPYNITQLAKRCASAEEHERERAATPKIAPDRFHAEGLMYRCCACVAVCLGAKQSSTSPSSSVTGE